jgi:Ni,Fe-hydrogenase I small subunit
MEGWKCWEGKKVFIILKNKRQYSGIVLEVEINPSSPLVWISIKDKFGNRISFVNSEIEIIQEEKRE